MPWTFTRSDLLWQFQKHGSTKWKTVSNEIGQKLERTYQKNKEGEIEEEDLKVY